MKDKVTATRVFGVIWPHVIYTICGIVVQLLTMYTITFIAGAKGMYDYDNINEFSEKLAEQINSHAMEVTLIAACITIPIMLIIMNNDKKNDIFKGRYKKYEKVPYYNYLLIIPFSIVAMLSANYFTSILIELMPEAMVATYDSTEEAIYGSSVWIQFVAAGFFGPIVEELINRGVVYNRIKKMSGVTCAAIISSILFGASHRNFVQAPYAFIIGLLAVYLYERYKSIIAPMILHVTANMFSLLLSQMSSSDAQAEAEIEALSSSELISALSIYALITGCVAFAIATAINKKVRPKEII